MHSCPQLFTIIIMKLESSFLMISFWHRKSARPGSGKDKGILRDGKYRKEMENLMEFIGEGRQLY